MAAESNGAVEQDASRGHGAKKRIDGKLRSGRGRTAKKMAAENWRRNPRTGAADGIGEFRADKMRSWDILFLFNI